MHTGQKLHHCKQCGKGFPLANSLQLHQVVHSGVKAHCCDQCGSSFTTAGSLRRHKVVHTGEKPYQCTHCEKTFKTTFERTSHEGVHAKKLNSHDKTSHDEHKHTLPAKKLFHCHKCTQKFSTLQALSQHQCDHLKMKLYWCEECQNSFPSSDHRKTHNASGLTGSSSGCKIKLKQLEIKLHRIQI